MSERGKAAVLDGPLGSFTVTEFDLPAVEPGAVLLRVELCGICGSDYLGYRGLNQEVSFPIILGHEITGTVEERGRGVTADVLGRKISKGDRLVLVPAIHCGKCYFCAIAKTPSKCLHAVQYGFIPHPNRPPHFTGGFAQYLYLRDPRTDIFRIDAAPEAAVLAEPLGVAIHAVARARVSPGDTVVVQGAGPIGLMTVLACRAAGARRVAVTGRRQGLRLDFARVLGADVTVDIDRVKDIEERIEIVRDLSPAGHGADAVFECAGRPEAVSEGLRYVRPSGVYCIAGNVGDQGTIPINPALDIMEKNIRIEGIYDHAATHFARAVSLIEKTESPLERMITHRIPLDDLTDAFRVLIEKKLVDGREMLKPVVDPW
jgi:L-iditol 2-dehydrogenase